MNVNEVAPFTREDMERARKESPLYYADMYEQYWDWRKREKLRGKREIANQLSRVLRFLHRDYYRALRRKNGGLGGRRLLDSKWCCELVGRDLLVGCYEDFDGDVFCDFVLK